MDHFSSQVSGNSGKKFHAWIHSKKTESKFAGDLFFEANPGIV